MSKIYDNLLLEVIFLLNNPKAKDFKVTVRSPGENILPPFYRKIELPHGRISDVLLGEECYWTRDNPILLDTPPGSGKSTWVRDYLIPLAKEMGKNLIWISNRVASSIQMKKGVMKNSNDPRQKHLTTAGIQQEEDFGHVRIITCQRLPALMHDPALQAWLKNVGYVVMDEAHMLAADAIFNEACDYYLKLLTERFHHAVRIYMTGTVEDVLVPLAKAEEENFRYSVFPPQWQMPREFLWYHQAPNFNAYNLSFYERLDDLISLIKKNPQEKWIAFSDSKDKGQEFAKKLPSTWYVDATRKSGKQWDLLVDDERFEAQVMISTAVLDSGVNVNDKAVKNIAIVADNSTALIQMLGRRRLKGNEKLNLYIADLNRDKIERRLHSCEEYLSWYDRFDSTINPELKLRLIDEIWKNEDSQLRKLFRLSKGQLYANELARHVLQRRRVFYQRIVSGETTFRREVEHWLGKEPVLALPEISTNTLDEFCEINVGQCLTIEQHEELKAIVFALSGDIGLNVPRNARKEKTTHTAINNRLEDMNSPYRIVYVKEQWWLCRIDRSNVADTSGNN